MELSLIERFLNWFMRDERRIRRELMCRFTLEVYWAPAIDRYLPAEQGRLKMDGSLGIG
jgi:hypothetical protein